MFPYVKSVYIAGDVEVISPLGCSLTDTVNREFEYLKTNKA